MHAMICILKTIGFVYGCLTAVNLLLWLISEGVAHLVMFPWYWIERWWAQRIIRKDFRYDMSDYGYRKRGMDQFGILWELPDKLWLRLNETVPDVAQRRILESRRRVLEVHDSSLGTRYILAVPRGSTTATPRGAVAWTFGLLPDAYQPQVET